MPVNKNQSALCNRQIAVLSHPVRLFHGMYPQNSIIIFTFRKETEKEKKSRLDKFEIVEVNVSEKVAIAKIMLTWTDREACDTFC